RPASSRWGWRRWSGSPTASRCSGYTSACSACSPSKANPSTPGSNPPEPCRPGRCESVHQYDGQTHTIMKVRPGDAALACGLWVWFAGLAGAPPVPDQPDQVDDAEYLEESASSAAYPHVRISHQSLHRNGDSRLLAGSWRRDGSPDRVEPRFRCGRAVFEI